MRLSSIRDRLKACLIKGCVECPMCKSENTVETNTIHRRLSGNELEVRNTIEKTNECRDCGVIWTERYLLSSISMNGIEEVRGVHTSNGMRKAKSIQD